MAFSQGNLVLYKSRPAVVLKVDDKIEIGFDKGKNKRVRNKDIERLHPGPVSDLSRLQPQPADPQEAWELLQGDSATLTDLAELVYGEYSPQTAWSAWQLLNDDLYFSGSVDDIRARDEAQLQAIQQQRAEKARAEADWQSFLQRVQQKSLQDEDRKKLAEVERLALGQQQKSRILNELNVTQSIRSAHAFLVNCGYWHEHHNPWPGRFDADMSQPTASMAPLPDEERRDLTHQQAFAIDDEGNQDPDDAISLDEGRIWVHIADVAALVSADSEMDLQARERGANLYLPETTIHMLPVAITPLLGMGLAEESPALSIGFALSDSGEVIDPEVCISRVKVTRMTYAQADMALLEEPFKAMNELAMKYRQKRTAAGSARIDLPEVSVRVDEQGQVNIRPFQALQSRALVTDFMLMAGEAVVALAEQAGLAIPYAGQAAPDQPGEPESLSEMFAYRRQFKPTQVSTLAQPHAGLGLAAYTRATSPLRRYSDLLVHQQLRAWLTGQEPLSEEQVSARIALAEERGMTLRRTERQSNMHWKRVFLAQHPDWQGEAVLVEKGEHKSTLLIPELAMDTKLRLKSAPQLDEKLSLQLRSVDLAEGDVFFRVNG
ncbi:MAG: RNB domain-containing ribonuclease [gamma proteobacterium symbiont of Bathyaustriella thionipta]|nr:RNB domain-containing ribonuclease [gamma proteobacterium symbiont of Bathyaustriella thionipta]